MAFGTQEWIGGRPVPPFVVSSPEGMRRLRRHERMVRHQPALCEFFREVGERFTRPRTRRIVMDPPTTSVRWSVQQKADDW